MVRLMCENTAKLASISHRKGAIRTGYDADFVIWDPDVPFEVCGQLCILFQMKQFLKYLVTNEKRCP